VVAAGTVRFGAREVLGMPGAVDKVFRALQVVPGITGAGRGTVFSGR
jgi:hypothetical protein